MKKLLATLLAVLLVSNSASVLFAAEEETSSHPSDATVTFHEDTDPTDPKDPEGGDDEGDTEETGDTGQLAVISVPSDMDFGSVALGRGNQTYHPQGYLRPSVQWVDKRGTASTGYKLTAKMTKFTSANGSANGTLSFGNGKLAKFESATGNEPTIKEEFTLESDQPAVEVASADALAGLGHYGLYWFEDAGASENSHITLAIDTNDFEVGAYTASIAWTLSTELP